MANFTQYYDLEKPLPEEEYDIAVFNTNADKIDTAIKNAGKELSPGLTMEYYGAAAPEGFLFCEGQAVSRTVYAKLFAVIGTQHGAGDGSTTFNLPDHRGRVGVGKSTEAEFNTLGKKGGEKNHILTVAEIASHNHTQKDHNHAQSSHNHNHIYGTSNNDTFGMYGGTQGGWNMDNVSANNNKNVARHGLAATTAANNAATAANVATGGGGAHNNLQPYIVCNQVIKY